MPNVRDERIAAIFAALVVKFEEAVNPAGQLGLPHSPLQHEPMDVLWFLVERIFSRIQLSIINSHLACEGERALWLMNHKIPMVCS